MGQGQEWRDAKFVPDACTAAAGERDSAIPWLVDSANCGSATRNERTGMRHRRRVDNDLGQRLAVKRLSGPKEEHVSVLQHSPLIDSTCAERLLCK